MSIGNRLVGRTKLKIKVNLYKGLSFKVMVFVELYTAGCERV
jgi:hypothetical protein